MLLTFLIDPPFLLFLGYLFAFGIHLSSRVPIGRSRALVGGLITLTIFNVAVGISYLWFPDWMWMYLFQTSGFPMWAHWVTLIVALVAYYLLFLFGFYWGVRNRARQGPRAWRPALVLLVLSGAIIIPVFRQYYYVGTYAEYVAGEATILPHSALAPIYNIALPVMVVLGGLLFFWARRERG